MHRNIYLNTITIPEALERIRAAVDPGSLMNTLLKPVHQCFGMVTAQPVWARYSSPTYHSAAMDGVAVRADKTFQAREGSPVRLKKNRDYFEVNTGNPMPRETDAVIIIEQVVSDGPEAILVEKPAFPRQNVRRIGEDIVATELLLPRNHELSAYDIGALLSAGIWEIAVWEPVKIEFIPTGDEVLDFTARPEPGPGQVIESNSQVFMALASQWGCEAVRSAPVSDHPRELSSAVEKALKSQAHIIVVGAGSSAGSRDYTRQVIEEHGRVLVHGIKAMPGKPTLAGSAGNKIIIGAPGYPVSSVICFEQIIKPLVCWLSGRSCSPPEKIRARLTRKIPSRPGMEEFVRVSVGRVKEQYVATPLARGAGMITTLTRAQGITRIPQDSEGIQQDKEVDVELMRSASDLDQVLIVVGSHDNLIDLLADELMGLDNPIRLASTHLGSMGGITAVKANAAHIAGMHLFDPQTEDYNFPFIQKYCPDLKFELINLAIRHQGLMVARGNPLNIRTIKDLTRENIKFINRQKGSGTRILLDHH
ncbi:MAG: molybdopterin biosynthesis protein, partial [Desulfonatronovibrionaceae bacterium]